jgi:serine/threonine protein kinase
MPDRAHVRRSGYETAVTLAMKSSSATGPKPGRASFTPKLGSSVILLHELQRYVMAALSWQDLELGNAIGAGQSAVVIQARLRRPILGLPEGSVVAVKRHKPWVLEQPGQLERIFRKVDTGRTVRHESLVLILGVVMDDGGRPALVMRYYDGPTLEDVLGKSRSDESPLPIGDGLQILRGLASAIDALHQNSVIHGDIKPANVIVTSTGPVLAAVGVIRSDNWPEHTTAGMFLGTIRYSAPEYLFGEAYDHRVDLFSFGAIAYEILVGRQFSKDSKTGQS